MRTDGPTTPRNHQKRAKDAKRQDDETTSRHHANDRNRSHGEYLHSEWMPAPRGDTKSLGFLAVLVALSQLRFLDYIPVENKKEYIGK